MVPLSVCLSAGAWLVLYPLWAATVGVVCLVVHHQLVVHKVEAVGLRFVWVQDHLTHWGRRGRTRQCVCLSECVCRTVSYGYRKCVHACYVCVSVSMCVYTHWCPLIEGGTRRCVHRCSCCWAYRNQTQNQSSWGAALWSSASQSSWSCWWACLPLWTPHCVREDRGTEWSDKLLETHLHIICLL